MNRFRLVAAVAVALLALAPPAWAGPPAGPLPAAETPPAAVGRLKVYIDGNLKFDQGINAAEIKPFSELVFDLYLRLDPGSLSLEVDGLFDLHKPFPVIGGPKQYDDTLRVLVPNPLPFGGSDLDEMVRVVLDLSQP